MPRAINPGGLFDATEYAFNQARIDDGTLFLSGQVGVGEDLAVAGPDSETQARRAFGNVDALLGEVGLGLEDVGKVVGYVVDLEENLPGYRRAWRDAIEEPYPCHTLLGVDQLIMTSLAVYR